jgi:hypothetical protein
MDIETSWVGSKIVLYNDSNVTFGGKLVGGIRVRTPRTPSAKVQPPAQAIRAATAENDDGLPF